MPTVYQRCIEFSRDKRFYWPQRHRKTVGAIIKKDYTGTHTDPLETIDSKEWGGPYKVFNYPDHYTQKMDEIISDYVTRITAKKPKKVSQPIVEKPAYPKPPPKEKKKRKRIPITKPAFSGNKFK